MKDQEQNDRFRNLSEDEGRVRRLILGMRRARFGCGGIRLFHHPGLIYPDEISHLSGIRKIYEDEIQPTRPDWGITSVEAAVLLNCSRGHAYTLLRNHKVICCRVRVKNASYRLFWHREQVQALVEKRRQQTELPVDSFVSTEEALRIMAGSRSSLLRYVRRGLLKKISLRRKSLGVGVRVYTFYPRAQVEQLAKLKRLMPSGYLGLLGNSTHPGAIRRQPRRSPKGKGGRRI